MEVELTCIICQEIYREPVVLPCGHSFCEVCLDKIITSSSERWTEARCPLGCGPITKPFQKNFTLQNVVSQYHQQNLQKSSRKRADTVGQQFCSEHYGSIADLFCTECNMAICPLCVCQGSGQHVGHVATTMDEWCSRLKTEGVKVEQRGKELVKTVEEIIAEVKEYDEAAKTLYRDYSKKVENDYERAKTVLDQWHKDALEMMKREATNLPFPEEMQEHKGAIEELCHSAESLEFPPSNEGIAEGVEQMEELKARLDSFKTQVDEMKTQNDLAKESVEGLEDILKTQLLSFNKEADYCVEAVQQIMGSGAMSTTAVGQPLISLGVPKQVFRTSSPDTQPVAPLNAAGHTVLSPSVEHAPGASTDKHSDTSKYFCLKDEDPHLWHPDFVKMPFSKKIKYSVTVPGMMHLFRKTEARSKWNVICEALSKPIRNVDDLQKAISSYNKNVKDGSALQKVCNDMDTSKKKEFFGTILPDMIQLALSLPVLCPKPIPLLKNGVTHSITMSQHQAACLLANAFFCTFEEGPDQAIDYGINFTRLYQGKLSPITIEKLKCLLQYFRSVTEDMPHGKLTYSRGVLKEDKIPDWGNLDNNFTRLHISSRGTIEDDGAGMLQVTFTNKNLGDGVFSPHFCGQQAIRSLMYPEFIVSLLFTECLQSNEAIMVTGCQRFNRCKGYGKAFEWAGHYDDVTQRDSSDRLCSHVVAIDALPLMNNNQKKQCDESNLRRELNKAYVGFHGLPDKRVAIATGNWGCGNFGGDPRLKALIQLMAAAVVGRDVCYFTYADDALTRDIYDIHKLVTQRHLTVGNVWSLIRDYSRASDAGCKGLYDFITRQTTPA